jgi:putative transposase
VFIECRPAPGFDQMSEVDYRKMLSDAIARVEADAAEERTRTGRTVLGRKAILAQCPTDSPRSEKPRRELNPQVAAKDKGARRDAIQRFKAFRDMYADMRDGWLAGMSVVFPAGTWWLQRFAKVPCVPPPKTD